MKRRSWAKAEVTHYSKEVPGEKGNYRQAVGFDDTNGYVGIGQWTDTRIERVLLSPRQVRALRTFLSRNDRRIARKFRESM